MSLHQRENGGKTTFLFLVWKSQDCFIAIYLPFVLFRVPKYGLMMVPTLGIWFLGQLSKIQGQLSKSNMELRKLIGFIISCRFLLFIFCKCLGTVLICQVWQKLIDVSIYQLKRTRMNYSHFRHTPWFHTPSSLLIKLFQMDLMTWLKWGLVSCYKV